MVIMPEISYYLAYYKDFMGDVHVMLHCFIIVVKLILIL